MGVCVEATPPALDAASGFAWDDTVRLRAEGSDTSRDPTATDHLSRDEGDRFVGRAVVYVGPRVAAVMQALRVTLVDARGLRSETPEDHFCQNVPSVVKTMHLHFDVDVLLMSM